MKLLIRMILLVGVAYALITGYNLWTYGNNLDIPKADAAIVLGAAQWNGQPSPVFEGRLKQGIELYNDDKVDYLVFTGGTSENAVSSEAEVGMNYAMANGVPREDILVENQSLVTRDNVINAKQVATDEGIDSYLLVSDQYHLKRAVELAKSQGMDVTGVPTKYSAYETMETKLPFFLREWVYLMGQEVTGVFSD
ncbi:YdcF family protein [Halobacillus locisalis]|uniref:YdcF family protein n=1 Tax=Halobacillus locisalis TaxID=220753 RepID=A0A838CU23_9BACI|nr:YdcF family protein [Halobacillus locisalis]MBA2175642.1 YdcF family protein [Halobacillus locisalis]